MEKKLRTRKPKPNWNGWTDWFILHTPEIISCCDCGLAHEFRFKNINSKLHWKAKRHKLTTKQNRSEMKRFILIEK